MRMAFVRRCDGRQNQKQPGHLGRGQHKENSHDSFPKKNGVLGSVPRGTLPGRSTPSARRLAAAAPTALRLFGDDVGQVRKIRVLFSVGSRLNPGSKDDDVVEFDIVRPDELGAFEVVLKKRFFGTRSDSLTFLDATLCTDEGLLSLQIPLVRRAPSEQPSTQWMTYKRGKNMWDASDGGGKATLRNWMSMLDQVRCEGGMVGGFGYWKGAWQSKSRPGPFLVLFTPIWAAIAVTFTLVATLCWRRMQFRLVTMLFGTACVSVVLWLLTLLAAT